MVHVIATDSTQGFPGVTVKGYNKTDRQDAANRGGDGVSTAAAAASASERSRPSFASMQHETGEEKSPENKDVMSGDETMTPKQLQREKAKQRDLAAAIAAEQARASKKPGTAPSPTSGGFTRSSAVLAQIERAPVETASASEAVAQASRPFMDNDAVFAAIDSKCHSLAVLIQNVQKEKNKYKPKEFRSGLSCAEAHALALYCKEPNKYFNLTVVRFSPPSDDGRSMSPCNNCQTWLEPLNPGSTVWWKIKRDLLPESGAPSEPSAFKPTQGGPKQANGWNSTAAKK